MTFHCVSLIVLIFAFYSFHFAEDSYGGIRSGGVKITPVLRRAGPKIPIAQSLPMAVPIFNQRNEDDYEEVSFRFHIFMLLF